MEVTFAHHSVPSETTVAHAFEAAHSVRAHGVVVAIVCAWNALIAICNTNRHKKSWLRELKIEFNGKCAKLSQWMTEFALVSFVCLCSCSSTPTSTVHPVSKEAHIARAIETSNCVRAHSVRVAVISAFRTLIRVCKSHLASKIASRVEGCWWWVHKWYSSQTVSCWHNFHYFLSKNFFLWFVFRCLESNSPTQETASPDSVNPSMHMQKKLPTVFIQMVLSPQLSVLSVHSSTSATFQELF